MARDVLVTGVGAVTPVGAEVEATWSALLDGTVGADRVTRFDPGEYRLRSTVACEVDADLSDHPRVDDRSMGRYARLGVAAAEEAVADAGFDPDAIADAGSGSGSDSDAGSGSGSGPGTEGASDWPADRVGVSVGSGIGGVPEYEAGHDAVESGSRVSPRFVVSFLPNLAAGHLGVAFDARGPNRAPSAACAAGAHAVADAVDDVRLGRADVMLAGGTESGLTPTAMVGFDAMRALSTRDDPTASRPFDVDRDGFVMAEGAGVLVLEARDHARERGLDVDDAYAEVAGTGLSADATHPTRPPEDAHGLRRSIEAALADADRSPAEVDHVNAHATATPRGDVHEARAIAETLDDPLVWAPKGALGHTLGAAGGVETVLAARTVDADVVPPTANCDRVDPDCAVSVATERTDRPVEVAVCNAAGFGGTNASLVLTDP